MIEIFRRPQHHTKANIQYNFIIQKTFKVCILSCQRASVPFSTGPGGKELFTSSIRELPGVLFDTGLVWQGSSCLFTDNETK